MLKRRRALLTLASMGAGGCVVLAGGGRAFAEAQAYADQIFTDSAGRSVPLPAPPARILAAGSAASVALYAVAPEKLIGWVREPRADAKEFLAAPYRDLPAHGRLTGRGNTASPESVLALKPDLILDVGSIDDTDISLADRVQAQTGIPYALIDGGFARMPDSVRLMGRMIAAEEAAEDLAEYAEITLGELAAKLSAVPDDRRPRVYCARRPDGLETGLAGSISVQVLETVGAVNVAAAVGSGGLTTVSLEQIRAWNPEVILARDPTFYETVAANPMWQGIDAVRDRRIYLQPRLPFGWLDAPPGINRLIGVRWLMDVLYPDLFPQDLREETHTFYRRFYHVDLDDAQLDRLMRGAVDPHG